MEFKREIDKEDYGKRNGIFLIIVATIFSLLTIRLYYLQIIKGDYYKEKAIRNSFRENIVKAARGKIYDINGELLAENSTGYKLIHRYTKPISSSDKEILIKLHEKSEEVLSNISETRRKKLLDLYFDISYMAKIMEIDYLDLLDTFYTTVPLGFDHEIVVDEDIDIEKALVEVEKLPNNRIDIVEYNKRKYVEKELASHVIGYVKQINGKEYSELKDKGYNIDDLIGKKGIEKQYDYEMKGIDGREYVEVDVRGNVIKKLDEVKATAGNNVYLSINARLQRYMTQYMKDIVGTFIAIDVKTGKILTFVSSPELDSNLLSSKINQKEWNEIVNSKKTPLLNKGIAGLYPPGSTFKSVMGLAILESGISPSYKIHSTGKFEYGRAVFRDSHLHGHGYVDFYKSIEESVNTYYYALGLKIPRENIYKVATSFGIGQKTGIDIPGELEGLLPTPEWKKKKYKKSSRKRWLPGDTINLSIGQGYLLTTPIQILMVYQAIANNGVKLEPTLVDRFVSQTGMVTINEAKIKNKIDVSDENLKILQKALEMVVKNDGGTANILRLPYVNVSAKTGTAQNSGGENHSWIAGYFPSENPKIAFVSFVENGGYGGVAAGRQAREFITQYYNKGEKNIGKENKN
ncbi:penicillin-binding protein 2 [Oceanivirga salmonicida]|uniref:penicillin-binding protein 2 n=1 Tax=Oceanivirga salmonicida TaxID=1769291 RepID=UPI0009E8B168|nr:penicillin-binding protein 2 [Oceanivirga salmonicida]